jgi:hypothetical protein
LLVVELVFLIVHFISEREAFWVPPGTKFLIQHLVTGGRDGERGNGEGEE